MTLSENGFSIIIINGPDTRRTQNHNTKTGPAERDSLLTTPPLMDLVELPDGICLYCDLPGTTPERVTVMVDGEFLHVHAESFLTPIRGKIHTLEFCDTLYKGKIRLPVIDAGKLKASLANGLLRVFMPFPPRSSPVRIPVNPE